LDLSKGTDGNGAYVKPIDGVIAGAHELTMHLEKYQKVTFTVVTGFYPPTDHDLGDPMFVLGAGNGVAGHSFICSSLDATAIQLYSAHTNDCCGTNLSSSYPSMQLKFFHIKSSIPAHCSNCVQDGDETGVDCGGSCPPCQHAKNAVNYNYNTSSLPGTTRSFGAIDAGDATVEILSGQDVTFIAAGDVTLKPGFHAKAGSNFKVQKAKTRKDAGADCGEFCEPHKNRVCLDSPPNNDNYGWNLANASSVSITIYQAKGTNMYAIYSSTITVETDGYHVLWDLTSGVNTNSFWTQDVFWYNANVTTCKGEERPITGSITLLNCLKSLSSDSGSFDVYESIIQDTISQNMNWLIFPNPNSGSFTVTSENFQQVKQIQVINPLGQIIYSMENPVGNTVTLPNGTKGTYFVRITTETESVTKKILVE
jgi:hypothetical protein